MWRLMLKEVDVEMNVEMDGRLRRSKGVNGGGVKVEELRWMRSGGGVEVEWRRSGGGVEVVCSGRPGDCGGSGYSGGYTDMSADRLGDTAGHHRHVCRHICIGRPIWSKYKS